MNKPVLNASVLRKGVAIRTRGLSAEQYSLLVEGLVLMGAGRNGGNYAFPMRTGDFDYLMWDDNDDIDAGPFVSIEEPTFLTFEDVITMPQAAAA